MRRGSCNFVRQHPPRGAPSAAGDAAERLKATPSRRSRLPGGQPRRLPTGLLSEWLTWSSSALFVAVSSSISVRELFVAAAAREHTEPTAAQHTAVLVCKYKSELSLLDEAQLSTSMPSCPRAHPHCDSTSSTPSPPSAEALGSPGRPAGPGPSPPGPRRRTCRRASCVGGKSDCCARLRGAQPGFLSGPVSGRLATSPKLSQPLRFCCKSRQGAAAGSQTAEANANRACAARAARDPHGSRRELASARQDTIACFAAPEPLPSPLPRLDGRNLRACPRAADSTSQQP